MAGELVGAGVRLCMHNSQLERLGDPAGKLLWDQGYGGPDGTFGYGFGVATDNDRRTASAGLLAGASLDDYAAVVRTTQD